MPPVTNPTRDTHHRFPSDISSHGVWLSRARYRSLSVVAVGLYMHEWAVIRLPSLYAIGAATGTRDAAFPPVLTRDTLREMACVS